MHRWLVCLESEALGVGEALVDCETLDWIPGREALDTCGE